MINFQSDQIFNIRTDNEFEETAIRLFHFQYQQNSVYRKFVQLLKIAPESVNSSNSIPCMPVEFFKTHRITCGEFTPDTEFHSSGTTGNNASKHFVKDISLYEKSLLKSFELSYGPAENYCFFALLPSYLERENASLVYMLNTLISKHPDKLGGFYLHNHNELIKDINTAIHKKQHVILWGVSFALLDFAENFSGQLKPIRIIETGGMKGRRQEITRGELHTILKKAFHPISIDSEYGMTELLSQAWSVSETKFQTPPWMKVFIRDIHDPRNYLKNKQQGLINVIDLANVYSCAFLETQDLGKTNADGFEVLGRFDNSELRGCNLMI